MLVFFLWGSEQVVSTCTIWTVTYKEMGFEHGNEIDDGINIKNCTCNASIKLQNLMH